MSDDIKKLVEFCFDCGLRYADMRSEITFAAQESAAGWPCDSDYPNRLAVLSRSVEEQTAKLKKRQVDFMMECVEEMTKGER